VIPSCTQTFSKGFTQFVQGVSPIFIERGQGGLVFDVDGNSYIDYPLGLGAITLGHAYPEVDQAVVAQLQNGVSYSLPHRLEVELAERLCEIIPCAEMVRFGKNGSDATTGAVRVARAVTGRDLVLCCGYHGWHDWYIGTTTRRRGVPRATQAMTRAFPYGDLEALGRIFAEHSGQVAAVIMEPMGSTLPPVGYLQGVKDLTHREGALLIFDEVASGFRVALGGLQQYFGVAPDLGCFGKGMANGYPISTVVGRRDVMEEFDRNFFSFTFGGETAALAASLATLRVLEREQAISHMWGLGRKLMDGYNYLARHYGLEKHTWCQGLPSRAITVFKEADGQDSFVMKSIFQQECVKRGVLFIGQHKFCLMHTHEQIEETLGVYDEAFRVVQRAYQTASPAAFLEGPVLEPVFRRTDY
jgi:glutamate-1-semialdehyde aminotransferase